MAKEALGSSRELDPAPWVSQDDDTCCVRATARDTLHSRFLPRQAYDQRLESYGGELVPDPLAYFCVEHRERHAQRACASVQCASILLLPRCGFITVRDAY